MKAIKIIIAVLFFLLIVLDSNCNQNSKNFNRPNILYIFTDDQSIRTISCYPEAHTWVKTPNIDKLAKEGVRFSYCYTGFFLRRRVESGDLVY